MYKVFKRGMGGFSNSLKAFYGILLEEELPQSVKAAALIVHTEVGKQFTLCPSYRLISLLDKDVKILTKMQAT